MFDLDLKYTPKPFKEYIMEDLVAYINSNLFKPCSYFIAGGACVDSILNKSFHHIKDIDIFFKNEEQLLIFKDNLLNCEFIMETDNAITYEHTDGTPIQLISKRYGEPYDVLDDFDINASQVGITSNKEIVRMHDSPVDLQFYEDCFRASTPKRMVKYQDKGYKLEPKEVISIIRLLSQSKDTKYLDFYNNQKSEQSGILILRNFLHSYISSTNKLMSIKSVYGCVLEFTEKYFDDVDMLEFWESFYGLNEINITFTNDLVCIAHYNYHIKLGHTSLFRDYIGHGNYNRVRKIYPEKFI